MRFSPHVHQVQRAQGTVHELTPLAALDEEDRVSGRRGELTKQMIDRDWPHQVEVIATVCEGRQMDVVLEFCRPLAVAPLCGRRVRHNDEEYLRYAFSNPADADAFQARFGGRRLTAAKINGRWRYEFKTPGEVARNSA